MAGFGVKYVNFRARLRNQDPSHLIHETPKISKEGLERLRLTTAFGEVTSSVALGTYCIMAVQY